MVDQLDDITEKILEVAGDLDPETRHFGIRMTTRITEEDYQKCVKMAHGVMKMYGGQDLYITCPHPIYGPLMAGFMSPVTIDFYSKFGNLVLDTDVKIVKDYKSKLPTD